MLAIAAFFVGITAPNLENFRPVSNDDAWLFAVSYKLAAQGIFGSDLYSGFFNADQHYFFNLPVQHFLQALLFKVFGAGIAQARWVSLAAAVVIIWTVSWITYRWYGVVASFLCSVLLVFWRSDLMAGYPGIPLLATARTVRYDLGAVAWIWLSLAFLYTTLQQPRWYTSLAAGVCGGLAALTQFFGVFILPALVLAGFWQRGKRALTDSTVYWICVGVILIVAPYLVYFFQHSPDSFAQFSSLHAFRTHLDSPSIYLENITREPARFAHLLRWQFPHSIWPADDRPFSPWILMGGILLAILSMLFRLWHTRTLGDRLFVLSFGALLVGLTLLDRTKAPLYAIALLPSVCMLFAIAWAGLLHWSYQRWRFAGVGVVVVLLSLGGLALITLEGLRAYRIDLRQSAEVSRYLDVGAKIRSYLFPRARVLGAERWWWALRDHPYLAMNNLWWQWDAAAQRAERTPEFQEYVARAQSDFIVMSADTARARPDVLQAQVESVLARCATKVADWTDPNYFRIEIYQILKSPAGSLACQP